MARFDKYFLIFTLFFVAGLSAQEKDSVKTYELEEITVKSGIILKPKQVLQINSKEVKKADASVLADLGRYIPSVKVQTNSRGETLFYLRGSNTRQIALFFDGVPLNIPWDNRIDLSQIPTEAIEEMSVTKGIPSIVYGANTPAGVVNVNSKEYTGTDQRKVSLQFGENNYQKYAGSILGGTGNFSYLASASYNTTNGFNLPENYKNVAVNPGKLRLNSDRKSINIFSKVRYSFSALNNIGFTFSYIDSEKGVPAETDVESPRFWRYPVWKKSTFGINGSYTLNNKATSLIAYSFSGSKFNSEIHQFTDLTYSVLDEIEKSDDDVLYGRLIFTHMFGKEHILKLSASGFASTHKESFLTENYSELDYSQNVYSSGAEYEFIQPKYKILAGITLDGSSTPKTGDKPSKDAVANYSYNFAFVYSITKDLTGQLNFGRKLRFPTPRESFSGALGRFILNPDLGPEISNNGEINFSYSLKEGSINTAIFLSQLQDGIIRTSVNTSEGRKFQRINKDAIRTLGVEFNSDVNLTKDLTANFNFTYMSSNGKSQDGSYSDTLEYKPNIITGINLDYTIYKGLNAVFEGYYVGEEFGLKEGSNKFERLPDYLLLNLRMSYLLKINNNYSIELFLRLNNILDRLYFTQWSLPEAGRQLWFGLSTEF